MCSDRSGSSGVSYVVKNTFIEAVVSDDEGPGTQPGTRRPRASSVCVACMQLRRPDLSATNEDNGQAGIAESISAICLSLTEQAARGARPLSPEPLRGAEGELPRLLASATAADCVRVARGLRGSTRDLALTPGGREVLLKLIRSLSHEGVALIAKELDGGLCATNVNGSVVLVKLFRSASELPEIEALAEDVLASDVSGLCTHKAGHEVVMALLARRSARQRAVITSALRGSIQRFARHRFAARVLAEALLMCPTAECEVLAADIMSVPGAVVSLACHSFGVDVVRALLKVPRAAQQARLYLQKSSSRICKDKFGSKLAIEVGLSAKDDGLF